MNKKTMVLICGAVGVGVAYSSVLSWEFGVGFCAGFILGRAMGFWKGGIE